jgi:tungstate transport system ATP-binding protein
MSRACSALPLRLSGVRYAAGGVEIIRGVTLDIETGSPNLLVGPNGAAESVLLRLMHGLLAPTAGPVDWAGVRQRTAPPPRRHGVPAGGDAAPLGARQCRLPAAAARPRLAGGPGADGVGAGAGGACRPGRASRAPPLGRRVQRLALALAWALAPAVLFLDEPIANQDPAATRAVEAVVAAIAAGGTKVVMTSHDLPQARRLAGDIVFLHHGRVLEPASASAFFAAKGIRTPAASCVAI